MITLHRPRESSFADKIEESFGDMTLNYAVQIHSDTSGQTWIEDDKEGTIRGEKTIDDYLFRLRTGLEQERSITGDACYIDPETGKTC